MSEMFYDNAKNNLCVYAQSEFNRARGDYLLGIGPNPGRNADEYGIKHGIHKYIKGS